jgi:hypothetical protein
MENFAIVIYTHTQYSDAWEICFDAHEQYTTGIKKYVFLNKKDPRIPVNYTQVIYTDNTPYTNRFREGLEQVTEKYVLLTHEDFFLFNNINYNKIQIYLDTLESNNDISFIRLLKCGETSQIPFDVANDLYKIPSKSNYIFAVQAAIWDRSVLHKLYKSNPSKIPSKMENPHTQHYCRNNNINGLYCHNNSVKKRGRCHWDSPVYPYMATGIVAGKWNHSEYSDEYKDLINRYKIDMKVRGMV